MFHMKNMFETGVIRANKCQSLRQVRTHYMDIFSIFFNMNVCCMCTKLKVYCFRSSGFGVRDRFSYYIIV